jgi:hypothetical protein
MRSLSGFFLEFFCQKNPSSCVKLKYHSTVAYSIFEQLTNPIQGLLQHLQRSSAVAHMLVRNSFENW